MQLLGIDIGSSSIKVAVIEAQNGVHLSSATLPKEEMRITSKQENWAEQSPEIWWWNLKLALKECFRNERVNTKSIKSIGITYQMHGLVLIDKDFKVLRPAIIWCDSRAVDIGNNAFKEIGNEKCLLSLLNSPGNFTASKLAWVKNNEPKIYEKIHKIMLPGDYIALQLTGEARTTIPGLSEGIFWDYAKNEISKTLLDYYKIDKELLSDIVPTFGEQGLLQKKVAQELGLPVNIPVSYRAGDQPNNAFSLNVLEPGEIAANGGTSGVVYGVSEKINYDKQSRVNTFLHVNNTDKQKRLGVLLCINGTGIMNSWAHKNIGLKKRNYDTINNLASEVSIGSDGLLVMPFGNGVERMLLNKNLACRIENINFNIHNYRHIYRAVQEGVAFSFYYGIKIMKKLGIEPSVIRAGKTNMFLSTVFRDTLANVSDSIIELYNTDGAIGAARGAGIGSNIYTNMQEAFIGLTKLQETLPDKSKKENYTGAYNKWEQELNRLLHLN